MKIRKKQIEKIKKHMPIERKPAKISNQKFLNASFIRQKTMQMKGIAKEVRELACNLHEIQQMGEKRNHTENF